MKLMICGHGRHGKDTVAKMIAENLGLTWLSSSQLALDRVIYPNRYELFAKSKLDSILFGAASEADCKRSLFEGRHDDNGRRVWYEAICEYNKADPCRLMKDLYSQADIYVGCRSLREFKAGKESKLFDLSIWVDASERLRTSEVTCGVEPFDCDITIENNSTMEDLSERVANLTNVIGSKV